MKRLSNKQVWDIFHRRGAGFSLAEIGTEFGISRQFALKILQREAYKHVRIEDSTLRLANSLVPEIGGIRKNRNQTIINLHCDGRTGVEISRISECAQSTVCRVIKKYYQEL